MNFIDLCKKGNIIDVQEYYINNKVNIHACNDDAFLWSCYYGHIKVAQWLHSLGGVNIHVKNDYVFRWSCINGHIKVAQWVHSLGGVNIHTNDDYAFQASCRNGHIKIVQWLHSLGGVNIHAGDDIALRYSCYNGQIKVAQWIHSLGGVNIHAGDDIAFRYSCSNGHTKIAQWLQTLCEDYHLIVNGNKIVEYKIKNPIEDLIESEEYDKIIDKLGLKIGEDIDDICCICMDDTIIEPIEGKCGHSYCMECILDYRYVNKKEKCPYCMEPLELVKIDILTDCH
jgi:hypothetical protein